MKRQGWLGKRLQRSQFRFKDWLFLLALVQAAPVKAATPGAVLAFKLFFHAAVAKAVALVANEGSHCVERLDECNLVLNCFRAGHLSDQELVAVLSHGEHGVNAPDSINVGGLRKVAETPISSFSQPLANQPQNIVMPLLVNLGNLHRVGSKDFPFCCDEVLKVEN